MMRCENDFADLRSNRTTYQREVRVIRRLPKLVLFGWMDASRGVIAGVSKV